MKIAFFVYEFPPKIVGGLGTYAMEVARRIVMVGHEVSVFTMNDDEASLPIREMWRGVEVHRPVHIDISDSLPHIIAEDVKKWGRGIDLFSKVFTYNILSAHGFINEIARRDGLKYDIAVAHDWLSIISAITVKKELKMPLAFHIHSTEKGRTLGNGSEIISSIEHKGGEISDKNITVSYAMKDELKDLGFQSEKIEVCYNGIDPEKYDPKKVSAEEALNLRKSYGVEDDEPLLLFIGRLTIIKGVDRLIIAMSRVIENIPKARLLVVGVGAMEPYLKVLINRFNLQNNVKICPKFLTEEEKIAHYAACDLAVFPSLYEPFGIVCAEAMSMGKPVVVGARGVSGMREIVVPSGPDQCGFHINPYDPGDIAKFVTVLLEDEDLRKRCGKNARRRVLEAFTWKIVAENTLRVYDEVVQ
ncbi:glycosyltransferase family 4 protein [Candidatus Bathyarchaeota archaeon]|nr:glycosyltransferase family 4 protein [Candidatus Bathyarchaeota archaeon]